MHADIKYRVGELLHAHFRGDVNAYQVAWDLYAENTAVPCTSDLDWMRCVLIAITSRNVMGTSIGTTVAPTADGKFGISLMDKMVPPPSYHQVRCTNTGNMLEIVVAQGESGKIRGPGFFTVNQHCPYCNISHLFTVHT